MAKNTMRRNLRKNRKTKKQRGGREIINYQNNLTKSIYITDAPMHTVPNFDDNPDWGVSMNEFFGETKKYAKQCLQKFKEICRNEKVGAVPGIGPEDFLKKQWEKAAKDGPRGINNKLFKRVNDNNFYKELELELKESRTFHPLYTNMYPYKEAMFQWETILLYAQSLKVGEKVIENWDEFRREKVRSPKWLNLDNENAKEYLKDYTNVDDVKEINFMDEINKKEIEIDKKKQERKNEKNRRKRVNINQKIDECYNEILHYKLQQSDRFKEQLSAKNLHLMEILYMIYHYLPISLDLNDEEKDKLEELENKFKEITKDVEDVANKPEVVGGGGRRRRRTRRSKKKSKKGKRMRSKGKRSRGNRGKHMRSTRRGKN